MRAAVQLRRQADRSWKPVGVWQATPDQLQSRFLAGSGLEAFARNVHEAASKPLQDDGTVGTWEDWIEYAMDALSNGHDLHIVEVKPELTVHATFARDVLGLKGDDLKAYRPTGIANLSSVPIADLEGPEARA